MGGSCSFSLVSRNWFSIHTKETPKGVLLSAALAVALGIVAIVIDFRIVYPRDMNVPFPESLAYYPSIAVFAEILFHLLPLAVFAVFLSAVFKSFDKGRIRWIAILIASLSDPAFQVLDALANHYPLWAVFATGLHVLVVNFLMLVIFRQYGFVSLFSFRLFYYIIWHIVWGNIRLGVLF